MTRSRRTKITLLGSVLSVVICCAMLASGTFAWFTSSVASGNNKIVAGNLDIALEYAPIKAGGVIDDGTWQPVEGDTVLFDNAALWEPGHTEYVYLRVRNAGSLALKYKLNLAVFGDADGGAEKSYTSALTGGKFKLSQYLVARKIDHTDLVSDLKTQLWFPKAKEKTAMGNLNKLSLGEDKVLLGGTSEAFTLAVYMPETGVEEATGISGVTPAIYIGLQLYAAQAASEADGFGTDYDKDADYNMPAISPAEEKMEEAKENLTTALEKYTSGEAIEETEEMKSVTANSIKEYKYTTGGRLPSGMTYKNSTIVFGDDLNHITVRHSFSATSSLARKWGLTKKEGSSDYILDVEYTDPKTWGEPQTVTVNKWSINYSVLAYAYNALNASGTDENVKNLCKALVVYYNAVMALEEG